MCVPVISESSESSETGESQLSDTALSPKKFMRRPDLTSQTRLHIACTALMAMVAGTWGTVTALSRQYMISRAFVYMLSAELRETGAVIFGDRSSVSAVTETMPPYYYMLSLRLEGRCSVEAVSAIMRRFGIGNSSVGSVSQTLRHFGSLLPDTLETDNDEIQLVVYLSDEIFSKSVPILVTVDPVSSAVLKIGLADNRKADTWKEHWKCLRNNGYVAVYLVCDEGRGLCSAQKEYLSDIFRQPDTYHAIAHKLGKRVRILENAAYKAIEREENCYRKLGSARTEDVISRRIGEWEEAKRIADEKIELYDTCNFLYVSVIEELNLFDGNGALRERKEAEANIREGLNLIESLGNPELAKSVGSVRRTLPDLLSYFDVAKSVVSKLSELPADREALQALCLAWQWRKNMIKAKTSRARKCCETGEKHCLEIATGYLQEDYDDIREHVYAELDKIVQSSSLAECINSIIRPYLNSSKNQITQETLNLIMFYHNHRRYRAGKRKGRTPNEILTGRKQEKDWIDLLLDIAEKKDPSFFVPAVSKTNL